MSDEQQIKETVQTYFDCMYESSAEKTHAAFHPNAKITGYLEDGLHEMSVAEFAGLVSSQQPSAKEKGEAARLDIISIDIAGDTAVTRVRDDYLGMTFLDTLSLLRVDGQWSIYNKLFHVEGPAG
ncbi:MAG: nuclear transport factor 2 family protein [Gammaproteobacteria bacterium]|nr:nuclear transport factor 2 family protein [Gammaproteobacteria bacterium]MBT3867162.1 nuclear transport factor 2 family protein [Gammaproteobacteria bacterium]MBT4379226.1 nuclear transport factor 2 family protein [Gammaproteobacteria bacterium]MBT4617096.1 nuclear transport factor 2 family protein [Gammaproteobacteria bacterium]MBT5196607.1 nuclear transport factor 2 family protein [Gammaproteobacteria bacterium]